MMTETSPMIAVFTSVTNSSKTELPVSPIVSDYVSKIILYVNTFFLTMLAGTLGTFTNTANIYVNLQIGLSGPTNISFFALSIFDLLVSVGAVLTQLTYNLPLSAMKLPSGALVSEVGMGSLFILFPCMGCSAWITAILSIERCLCISTPLKVSVLLFFFLVILHSLSYTFKNGIVCSFFSEICW